MSVLAFASIVGINSEYVKIKHFIFIRTHSAAVEHGADVWVVIVRHLLVVGAQEAHGLVVVVLLLVVPGHRLVAVVGNVLPAGGTQQPQEGHLDYADGVALCIHVGELWSRRERGEELLSDIEGTGRRK